MRDFELNFLFNLGGHPVTLRENKAIDNSLPADHREQKLTLREMVADRGEQLAHRHSLRVLFLDFSVLVVQRRTRVS